MCVYVCMQHPLILLYFIERKYIICVCMYYTYTQKKRDDFDAFQYYMYAIYTQKPYIAEIASGFSCTCIHKLKIFLL